MNEVQWIGGGQVTEEQMRFFLSSATHDMIEEELSQLKHHKVSQPTPTIPISEDRDNLIYSQTREKDDGTTSGPSSFYGFLTWMNRSNEPVTTMPSTPKDKFNARMNWQKKAGDCLHEKKGNTDYKMTF